MFKLDFDADPNMTHFIGDITVPPGILVQLFGQPNESDGYKVSGEYLFSSDSGDVFTLYDWKSTSLYDDPAAPSPEEFWASMEPYCFHIGGRNSVNLQAFQEWLMSQGNKIATPPKQRLRR